MPAALSIGIRARAAPSRQAQGGLSLIELMIAITVALVLLAALAVMFGSSIKARNQIERSNRQIENGRYAIQLLRDDVQLAGFFGELDLLDLVDQLPGTADFTAVPDVCVTHLTPATDARIATAVTSNIAGDNAVNGLDFLAAVMRVHIQGFDNVDPSTLPACLVGAGVRPGTDIIVVRRARTCHTGEANCAFTATAPYLQTSQCNSQSTTDETAGESLNEFRLRADADMTQFDRMDIDCGVTLTPIRRYVTHVYYVANNNTSGDAIPTLKRLELISTGFTTTPLVEGIENLQIEYGLDTSGDGVPDGAYDASPGDSGVAADDVEAWTDVMAVRLHLLSRGTEPRGGYVDTNTYTLGAEPPVGPFGDAYSRQVFQTVIQLRNPVGRRQ